MRFPLLVLVVMAALPAGAQPKMEIVAGGGPDGLAATQAPIDGPESVAVDQAGNVYVKSRGIDTGREQIFRIDTTGKIKQLLNGPRGLGCSIALDRTGNLYHAEWFRIRRMEPGAADFTTIAGSDDPPNDADLNRGPNGEGGPAVKAVLFGIGRMAIDDAGNLYFSDKVGIRKIDARTGVLTTVGTGMHQNGPCEGSLAVDRTGRFLFWNESIEHRIMRLDTQSRQSTVFASLTDYPNGVALDALGNLYVTTTFSVLRIDGSGNASVLARRGFDHPSGIVVDKDRNVYVADTENNRVKKLIVDPAAGRLVRIEVAGGNGTPEFTFDGAPALGAGLLRPSALAFDASGNLYFIENKRVRRVDKQTRRTATVADMCASDEVGGRETPACRGLTDPKGIALDASNNLYIADTEKGRVRRVDTATGRITTVANGLASPEGVACDQRGNLYVADTNNDRVVRIDRSTNQITTVAGKETLSHPTSVAVDSSGELYVADAGNRRIVRVAPDGRTVTLAGGKRDPLDSDAGIVRACGDGNPTRPPIPCPVQLGSVGKDLFFLDYASQRFARLGPNGSETVAILNREWEALGLAVDAGGSLYFGDQSSNTVRRIVPATPGANDATIELLSRVNRNYRTMKSYRAEARIVNRTGNEEVEDTVAIFLDEPDKVRLEQPTSVSHWGPIVTGVLVGDGQKLYKARESPPGYEPAIGASLPTRLGRYLLVYDRIAISGARLLRDENLEFQGRQVACAVVEVRVQDESPHQLWIDRQRNLVLRESYQRERGPGQIATVTVSMAQIEVDPRMPAEWFEVSSIGRLIGTIHPAPIGAPDPSGAVPQPDATSARASQLPTGVSTRYGSVSSYETEGEYVAEESYSGGASFRKTETLRIAYARPGQWFLRRQDGEETITDGRWYVTYDSGLPAKPFTRRELSQAERERMAPMTHEDATQRLRFARVTGSSRVTINGQPRDCTVVEARYEALPSALTRFTHLADSRGTLPATVTYCIDEKASLILRWTAQLPLYNVRLIRLTFTATGIQTNRPLPPEMFRFTPQ